MKLNGYIEHTLLKQDASIDEIETLCKEAVQYGFKAVCISPYFVRAATGMLKGTGVDVVTVIGFPLGYSPTPAKVEEVKKVINEGANEVDMVINISALKNQDTNFIKNDINSVAVLTQMRGCKIKVILETNLLTNDEIKSASLLCKELNVDFIKTCTGYFRGVKIEHVKLIKEIVGNSPAIKASGGIKDPGFAKDLINAGATRLGCSASVNLVS